MFKGPFRLFLWSPLIESKPPLLEQPGFRFRRPYLEPRAKRTTWIVRKKMAKSRKIERCLM